jgi:hypothetical protein
MRFAITTAQGHPWAALRGLWEAAGEVDLWESACSALPGYGGDWWV